MIHLALLLVLSRAVPGQDGAPAQSAVQSGEPAGVPAAADTRPWSAVVDWLGGERERMAGDLERAKTCLLERSAAAGRTDLVGRLEPTPTGTRPKGYGVLPSITENGPLKAVDLREKRYELTWLSTGFAKDLRDAGLLPARVEVASPDELPGQVDELERLRKRLTNFEDHIDYHRFWQQEIEDDPRPFDRRNPLLAKASQLQTETREGGDPEAAAALRKEIVDALAPFDRVPLLSLGQNSGGWSVLRVPVVTDVADEAFRETFRAAAEETFNASGAALAARLRIEVVLEPISLDQLYPEGAPSSGDQVNEKTHLARFPQDVLVLTTGAPSTHAFVGRAVVLGPGRLSRRALAHEFAHLLGFRDAYLRGYQGDPAGPFGPTIVEWVGLQDDLMGSPAGGAVGEEMVSRILSGYGP